MEANISFSKVIKEELCTNTYDNPSKLKALLSAYIRINGHLSFKDKKSILTLKSENAKIAKFIYSNIKELYNPTINMLFLKSKILNKSTVYVVEIIDEDDKIINDLEISFLDGKISKTLVYDDETISGYLAGAFLASGSINSPESSNYHLEIALNNENYAKWVARLFARYKNTNIEPKITKRRNNYVIYLKKSDKISDFLAMVGAIVSCMEFENYRVDRDYLNNANRLTNLDTANMSKTVKSAKKQLEYIKIIEEKVGLAYLSDRRLAALCKIRKENETASMLDISYILSDYLHEDISKSSVARLFKKLEKLALALK